VSAAGSNEPHRNRRIAESFGVDPERYDRIRPRYPDGLVAAVVAGSPGLDLLDVGIGTGIAARQFRAAGCRVLGVEVDVRMAEFARRHGFDVEVATFESWDPAGRTFDAVVAGQTWHWIDPVAGAQHAARVLRPGGRLAVFWNIFRPPPEVSEIFAGIYRRVLPDAPMNPWARPSQDAYRTILGKAADGIRDVGAFEEPEQWHFGWQRTYTRAEWQDQIRTGGDASLLSPEELEELVAGTGAAVDELGGGFTMGYDAVSVTAVVAARGPALTQD
jgi:SAM-dependent methyltransferase